MVLRSGRRARDLRLAPLLVLLFLGASAATQFSTEKAYRAARAAADRDDLPRARSIARDALARPTLAEDQWVWALRVLQAEIAAKGDDKTAISRISLPGKYATTEAAVFRLIARGIASDNPAEFFEQARRLAEKHQPQLLVYAHIAFINVAQDDYEVHARKAVALAKNNRLLRANALNGLTRRYTGAGHYAKAVESGKEAMEIYTALGADGRIATGGGNLGWAYHETGNWEMAEELFRRAEAAALRTGRKDLVPTWRNQLGNVLFAREQFEEAARSYEQALQIAPKDGAILTNLARTSVERGQFAAASQYVAHALAQSNGDQRLRARIVHARIDAAWGEHERAEKTLLEVIAAKEKHPATEWSARAHLALVYAHLQRNAEAERYFLEAIKTARQAKEAIKDSGLRISFFNAPREVFNGYVDFLVRLNRKEDALKATELIRAAQNDQTIDARAFARQTGATILCYWLGRDRSHAWRVTPNEVAHAVLPPAKTIEGAVADYAKALAHPRTSLVAARTKARTLYDMLVAPVASRFTKDARVVIVADGALHALNFETLVPPSAPQRYWIEDVILSSAGSLRPRVPRKVKADTAMLIVGDPVPAVKEFPKLANAATEIRTVAAHFPRRVILQGAKATPSTFAAASPQKFEFLHFAAHGVAVRKLPLESAVILSRDADNEYELLARDIADLKLQALLVTISSCYGAGDRTFAGEGLVGLAWAFSNAGADHVIAALTKVDDTFSPKLMDRMYGSIRNGDDPAEALRNAKLKFVREGGAYSMPRYWAPFMLYSGS